jgi:hypothetical protein
MKCESPTTYLSKVMTKVKVFEKKVRGSRSWYQMNGLAIRNTREI